MPFKKGNKIGGRRSARTSNVIRTPTPPAEHEASDEEMVDGDDAREGTPQEEVEEDDEDAATPAQDDEDEADSPPTITTIPRRRGRGRGAGRNSARLTLDNAQSGDEAISESGTPFRRKRGRPVGSGRGGGRGGFRGRRKGVQPETPRVMDRDGNILDVINDEAAVDDDPEGNEKVDELGQLLGGRDYRVRTFTINGKGERLYMLSTEPARCCGFRDSYLFFTKHPKLYKVLLNDEEKLDLIGRDILPSSYKGRNIGVVTARSVFREFGARIIVGGRRVIDDYKVTEARENGEVEGELADPEDRVPDRKEEYNRNRYVAWHGASDVYHKSNQAGAAVQHPGRPGQAGKRRNNITVQNWQFLHAKEASRFNSSMTALRQANLDGVYDNNTNMMFYPKIMQPTHARWEQIPPPCSPPSSHTRLDVPTTNGDPNGHLPNGTPNHEQEPPNSTTTNKTFTAIPPLISRNFAIIDTHFSSPSMPHPGFPGPDGMVEDSTSGPNGLASVPEDVVDELPLDCRRAFEQERERERSWKKQWGVEAQSGLRGQLRVGLMGWPV